MIEFGELTGLDPDHCPGILISLFFWLIQFKLRHDLTDDFSPV